MYRNNPPLQIQVLNLNLHCMLYYCIISVILLYFIKEEFIFIQLGGLNNTSYFIRSVFI